MLHTITGKILKSSYFWLSEIPGCYKNAGILLKGAIQVMKAQAGRPPQL
jgi:hypothetical protein